MKNLLDNWKTSLAGLVVVLIFFASQQEYISVEVRDSIIALGVAVGLIAASDAKPKLMASISICFLCLFSLGSCSFVKDIISRDNVVKVQGSGEYKLLEFYIESKIKNYLQKKNIYWDSKSAYITFNLADKEFTKIFGQKAAVFFTKTGKLNLSTEKQEFSVDWKPYSIDSTVVSMNRVVKK